jgi:hypothetical protein
METTMKARTFIACAIAAAFAIPLAAHAGGDKQSGASSGGTAASGAGASGAEAMFKSLDKNKDGNLSRDEVKGTPHDNDFAALDKNNDGKLTRQEHAAAPEHAGDKAAAGGSAGGTKSKY